MTTVKATDNDKPLLESLLDLLASIEQQNASPRLIRIHPILYQELREETFPHWSPPSDSDHEKIAGVPLVRDGSLEDKQITVMAVDKTLNMFGQLKQAETIDRLRDAIRSGHYPPPPPFYERRELARWPHD